VTRRKSQRGRRVDELVRQVVADGLLGLADPHLRDVTVTGADVSSDAAVADVHVQLRGNERRREKALDALGRARAALQTRINEELHLRRTPILRFHEDVSADTGARIEELLSAHQPVREPADGEP
jgi:ribosome-binding factor A